MKKAVVVLSQKLQGKEYYARLNEGIKMFYNNNCDYIVLLSESVSEKNINFLAENNILKDSVLLEPNSKDTIGEAALVRENIVEPYQIKDLFVVSSDYHINYRARAVFDYVFAEDFDVNVHYSEVKTEKMGNRVAILDQLRSVSFFTKVVEDPKNKNILKKHPLYFKKEEQQ